MIRAASLVVEIILLAFLGAIGAAEWYLWRYAKRCPHDDCPLGDGGLEQTPARTHRKGFAVSIRLRRRFKVAEITCSICNNKRVQRLRLIPARWTREPDEHNGAFFAFSPMGEIVLDVVQLEPAKMFELDQDYFVDFTPVVVAPPETT